MTAETGRTMSEITFRQVPYIYPPERVFSDGYRVGHVEFTGDGWKAYDRDGEQVGFATHKAAAGRMLAEFQERGNK